MSKGKAELQWPDGFTQIVHVPGLFRMSQGAGKALTVILADSDAAHHAWPASPMGPQAQAWGSSTAACM